MPSPTALRGRPRGSRSRVFRYQPIACPERYLLTRSETAAAWGVDPSTISRWVRQSRETGSSPGPTPIFLGKNGKGPLRFCIDEVLIPSETMPCFLERMRADLAKFIQATSATTEKTTPAKFIAKGATA